MGSGARMGRKPVADSAQLDWHAVAGISHGVDSMLMKF